MPNSFPHLPFVSFAVAFFGWVKYKNGGVSILLSLFWLNLWWRGECCVHSPVLSGQGAFLRPLFTRAFFPHIAAPNTACHVLCVLCRGRIRGLFVFPRLPLHFYGVESLLQGACSPQCQPCPSLSGERIPFFPSPNLWERLLLCISYGEVGLNLAGRALFSVTSSPLSPCLYLSSYFTPKLLSAQLYMGPCAHFLPSQALLSC